MDEIFKLKKSSLWLTWRVENDFQAWILANLIVKTHLNSLQATESALF